MIRVLIIDSSAIVCAMLSQIMTEDKRFDVIALTSTSEKALSVINEQKPDLVLFNVDSQEINGAEVIKKITSSTSVPIIAYTTADSIDLGYRCIDAGALDILTKPSFSSMSADVLRKFCNQIYEVATSKRIKTSAPTENIRSDSLTKTTPRQISESKTIDKVAPVVLEKPEKKNYKVLVIGASTGGPAAIQTVLLGLGSNFPLPILITQHIDQLFDTHFSKWLDETTGIKVEMAQNGMQVKKGVAYIAPAAKHMIIKSKGQDTFEIVLTDDPPVHFLKPAVDKLFTSAAAEIGDKLISVLLTGMGKDGAEGMLEIKKKGGYTIAEHESTCIVYGMPKAAVECNAAKAIIPLQQISEYIKSNLLYT